MNNDKDDKDKKDQENPSVYTPEPPQVMNPTERPKKNTDEDKGPKEKKKEKKKSR